MKYEVVIKGCQDPQYSGDDKSKAIDIFCRLSRASSQGVGEAAGKDITLSASGRGIFIHHGKESK